MRRVAFFVGLVAAACAPSLPDGRIVCETNADCPPDWECRGDDRCYSPDAPRDGGAGPLDAQPDAPMRDASIPDAPPRTDAS